MNNRGHLKRKNLLTNQKRCISCGTELCEISYSKNEDLCHTCDTNKTRRGTIDKYKRMMYQNNALILDIETSGVSRNDQIVSLCLLNMKGEVVFHSYFKPNCCVNERAAELHGLNDEYLKDYPSFENVFVEIQEYLNDNIIFCWESIFVKKMLKQTLELNGITTFPALNLHSIKRLYNDVEYESEQDDYISINECFLVLDLPYTNCYDSIQDAKNLKDMIDCILFIHHKEEGVV